MKRFFQFLILIVAALSITSVAYAQAMVITMNDGKIQVYPVKDIAKMSWIDDESNNGGTSDGENQPQANNHEYVNLGLPSGTLWATCNVGANSPEEYGDYFAWGETEPKTIYSKSNYKWYDSSTSSYTKYVFDPSWVASNPKLFLDLEDDAARANWGGDWRMPTIDELDELVNYCLWTETKLNGVKGYQVTSAINGKSIFLPGAGVRYDSSLDNYGSPGYYWSSSFNFNYSDYSYMLNFDSKGHGLYSYFRYYGHTVRPVLSSAQNSQP